MAACLPTQAGLPGLIGVPATQLVVGQWADCAVVPGGNSVGDPLGPWPDLCGYAQQLAQPAFDLATLQVRSWLSVAAPQAHVPTAIP